VTEAGNRAGHSLLGCELWIANRQDAKIAKKINEKAARDNEKPAI
jgi:hypothetical protein